MMSRLASWLLWLILLVLGHLTVLLGVLLLIAAIAGGKRPWGSVVDFLVAVMYLGLIGVGIWICRRFVYSRWRRSSAPAPSAASTAVPPALLQSKTASAFESDVGVVGEGSYWNNEAEFLAGRRAMLMVRSPLYRSWLFGIVALGTGILQVGLGLLLVLGGLNASRNYEEARGSGLTALGFGLFFLAGGALCFRLIFGWNRRFRKAFRKLPGAGERIAFAFTSDRFLWRGATSEFRVDWRLFPMVTELRDGFVLLVHTSQSSVWIPKHAFQAPFDAEAAAAFLRSKIPACKTLNRNARVEE